MFNTANMIPKPKACSGCEYDIELKIIRACYVCKHLSEREDMMEKIKEKRGSLLSDSVQEAVTHLNNFSDDDLMKRYITHRLSRYPSTIEMDAIEHIFEEREIDFHGFEIMANFTHKDERKQMQFTDIK